MSDYLGYDISIGYAQQDFRGEILKKYFVNRGEKFSIINVVCKIQYNVWMNIISYIYFKK